MSPSALMSWEEPRQDPGRLPPVLALAGAQDVSVRPFQVCTQQDTLPNISTPHDAAGISKTQ